MKKVSLAVVLVACVMVIGACSSSSSSGGDGGGPGNEYATFGVAMNDVVPEGLKVGGANASLAAMMKELSGTCAADYTNCPYITAIGGGDSTSGEILMRLWGLDYENECSSTFFGEGKCFSCEDCDTGSVGTTNFIKPTMLDSPTSCGTTSTSNGRYVNLGIDPCFFDAMIGQISNIAECETVQGGAVDISSAVPWYASWGIPQTVNFSSYYSKSDGGGIWWTVNSGASGVDQYFLSLDSNWLYAGIKNTERDEFLFLGTGSPSYYAGLGEGSGVNISAYTGPLSAITTTFEVIQVRDQPPYSYIERLRSNGTHVWYQSWMSTTFPSTPSDVDAVKNSPEMNRCVEIGASVVTSKYVPLTDCVTSFGATSVENLNLDSNYTLKIIDGQTAGSIDFSTALTPTTQTSCLEEEVPAE